MITIQNDKNSNTLFLSSAATGVQLVKAKYNLGNYRETYKFLAGIKTEANQSAKAPVVSMPERYASFQQHIQLGS